MRLIMNTNCDDNNVRSDGTRAAGVQSRNSYFESAVQSALSVCFRRVLAIDYSYTSSSLEQITKGPVGY